MELSWIVSTERLCVTEHKVVPDTVSLMVFGLEFRWRRRRFGALAYSFSVWRYPTGTSERTGRHAGQFIQGPLQQACV